MYLIMFVRPVGDLSQILLNSEHILWPIATFEAFP